MNVEKFKAGTPVLVFLLLALAIAGLGYFVFRQQAMHLKEAAQRDLDTIAALKSEQINRWRNERRGDAQAASQDYLFESTVAQWVQEGFPSNERRQHILARLTTLQKAYDYRDIDLLDEQGALRLSTAGEPPLVSLSAQRLALEALRTGAILFSDLYRDVAESGLSIRLGVFAPLLDGSGRTIGVLVFWIDPDRFLFPLIQSWPTPSATAETLLVERAGNDVVYLNELRHRKETALAMRYPISDKNLPAAMVVQGGEGLLEGTDYRGVNVLAAARKIPDSPWFIVAKIDQQEVYAPIHERALLIAELTVAFIALSAALTALWWRQKSARMLAREYQSRLERQALVQHFDYLAKYANDIILLFDSEFRIVEMNDRALEAYGYTRDELLGRHMNELRTPAAADFDWQRQQLAERKSLLYETLDQRKDKTVFPVEISSRVIETEGKTYYQSIIRDISERKQAEQAFKRIEWLLTQGDDQAESPDAAVYEPPYGDLTALNAARLIHDSVGKSMLTDIVSDYLKLLGTSAAVYEKNGDYALGLFSSGWCRFLDQASRKQCGVVDNREALACGAWHCHESCWTKASKTSIETGQPVDIECAGGIHLYAIPIRTGSEIIGSLNIGYGDPPHDPAKLQELAEKYGVSCEELSRQAEAYESRPPFMIQLAKTRLQTSARLIAEIVERKRAEAEVKCLNDELEQRVEARTAELRAANTELESFAYAVSHDLRAPLRAMNGFSQALMEDYADRLDGEARLYLEQIGIASRHMSDLIDGLLVLSRSTRGELKQEALDISSMAERLLTDMTAAEPARSVEWTVEPGMRAEGDATMIEVAMRNLIDNAFKYTRKKPEATIHIYSRDTEGQRCFCVSDNGAGFDMAHAGKLFQPFQRLHRQEEFPGIGIGLATVQRIVHRHGGAIWADGAPGQGADFCFTLHDPAPLDKEIS